MSRPFFFVWLNIVPDHAGAPPDYELLGNALVQAGCWSMTSKACFLERAYIPLSDWPGLSINQPVSCPLAYHDGGGVGIGPDDVGHHRSVGHFDVLQAVNV